jgi:Carboxypeptidase regulatory-like domain
MKRIALVLVTALLAWWNPSSFAETQTGQSEPATSGQANPVLAKTYRVTGHVFDNLTGKPLSGATVSLEPKITPGTMVCTLCAVPVVQPRERVTTTDADGQFAFDDVLPGRISVQAAKDGYVLALHHRIGMETWAETQLTSDWSVDLYLARAASISGVARDHTGALLGKDASHGDIELFYVEDWGGRPKTSYVAVTPTFDADGTYRFDKLEPGRYFLIVNPGWDEEEPGGTENNRPVGEVPLRYPEPTSRQPAPLFTLGTGEHKTVDLQIPEQTLYHVSFTANPTTGFQLKSASGGNFRVQSNQREKGSYYVWLPDGRYWLTNMIPGESDQPVFFTVAGADVSGLHLDGAAWDAKGVPVTVQVSIEGSPDLHCLPSHPSDCDLANLELTDVEPGGTAGGGRDIRLTASTKPMETTLQSGRYAAVVMARKNLYAQSIRCGAFDLSQGLLPIHEGQAPAPIQVELAPGARIEGRVERDRKPVAAWVYALPTDRATRKSFRFFGSAETRNDGTFEIDGLAPGSWIVFASDIGNLQVDVHDRSDTAYWRRHGTRVHAEIGHTVHLVVKEKLKREP